MRTYRCLIGYTQTSKRLQLIRRPSGRMGDTSLSGLTVQKHSLHGGAAEREGFCKSEMGGLDELMKRGCHLHARHEGSKQDPYSARS